MFTLSINGLEQSLITNKFSDGALGFKLGNPAPVMPVRATIRVLREASHSDVLFGIAALVNICRNLNSRMAIHLVMPFLPYARQDRVMVRNDSFMMKVFAELLNGLHLDKIFIMDPHSDVGPALIDNCYSIPQEKILGLHFINRCFAANVVLVAPDAGALKKIHKVHDKIHRQVKGVVSLDKTRNPANGEITGMRLIDPDNLVKGSVCLIVDDICDGGATFRQAALSLLEAGSKAVDLWVTHALFSRGVDAVVYDGGIRHVFTTDSVHTPSASDSDKVITFETDKIIRQLNLRID